MGQFKAMVTVTWEFDSVDEKDAVNCAKTQIDSIMQVKPFGGDFNSFCLQVDVAKMKDRKKMIHLGVFEPNDVFPHICCDESKREYVVGDKAYMVKMNSDRYKIFKNNCKCVSCGLEGTKMILDQNVGDQNPHFNMYAEENGRLVLMTKDHILAKSKGGGEELANFTTCCAICNNLKGNYDISYEDVKKLREIHNNEAKLPKKQLRKLLEETRLKMAAQTLS